MKIHDFSWSFPKKNKKNVKKILAENRTNRAENHTNRAEKPGTPFFHIFKGCFPDLNSVFINQFSLKECAVWSAEVLAKTAV